MVDLDNAPALALYEKLGYQKFKQALDVWDGQTYTVDCFEKHLKGTTAVDTR